MEKSNTAARVRKLAEPLCEELGLFLWDVRFEKEGSVRYLRIFIDKDGGVDMDDCENFTRPFNKILDEEDPIAESYVLEVGSPGLGRELKRPEHFEACLNDIIRVKLFNAENGQKEFRAGLDSYDKEKIYCHLVDENDEPTEAKEFVIKNCAYIKLDDDNDLF
ncbi:MAG: ribosome maturation factor RimP [Oscillospiraceae bacterium]